MRVLNINKFYFLNGGTERYYFALAKLLEKQGHDVIPFSMEHRRNFPSKFSKYFVSNLDLSQSGLKLIGQLGRPIWSKEAKEKINTLLDDYPVDLAHIHMLYHHMSPSVLPELKKRNIPMVLTLHDYKLICPNYSLYTEGEPCTRCKKHKYYNPIIHKCLKDSRLFSAYIAGEMTIHKLMQVYEKHLDMMIAPSRFVRDMFVEFGQDPEKITVIPHFIDPVFLEKAETIEPLGGEPYLLYFGRLGQAKGVDKVLEMMYIYRPDLPLKIAGTGPMEPYLRDYVQAKGLQNQVEFLGHLDAAELVAAIKGARAVVVPSQSYETFGFAVLETMALGTPVAASAIGAFPELVVPELGRTFEPTDLKDMARAVEEAVAMDRSAMLPIARRLIHETYSPQRHYQSLRVVYDHVLK